MYFVCVLSYFSLLFMNAIWYYHALFNIIIFVGLSAVVQVNINANVDV